jgi:hypothetical protein
LPTKRTKVNIHFYIYHIRKLHLVVDALPYGKTILFVLKHNVEVFMELDNDDVRDDELVIVC